VVVTAEAERPSGRAAENKSAAGVARGLVSGVLSALRAGQQASGYESSVSAISQLIDLNFAIGAVKLRRGRALSRLAAHESAASSDSRGVG
jgi:hypothetical protein